MGKRTKTKSKRKGDKILLFLVEGDSDKRTLETPIEAFLDNQGISGIKVKFAKLSKTEDGKKVIQRQTLVFTLKISKNKLQKGSIELPRKGCLFTQRK